MSVRRPGVATKTSQPLHRCIEISPPPGCGEVPIQEIFLRKGGAQFFPQIFHWNILRNICEKHRQENEIDTVTQQLSYSECGVFSRIPSNISSCIKPYVSCFKNADTALWHMSEIVTLCNMSITNLCTHISTHAPILCKKSETNVAETTGLTGTWRPSPHPRKSSQVPIPPLNFTCLNEICLEISHIPPSPIFHL